MAYNQYSQGGYGQTNPYAEQQTGYGHQEPYGQPYSSQEYGQGYGQPHDVEMQPLTSATAAPYSQSTTPALDIHQIRNECRAITDEIVTLEDRVSQLKRQQRDYVQGNGSSAKEIDATGADIMTSYRGLGDRVRKIKGKREANDTQNRAQVQNLDRRIKKSINDYQKVESDFRRDVQEQQKRQYLIVNPNATEQEITEATQDGGDAQIFQQALLNSDRRGQAQSTLRNVRERHDAIQKIERTMMELQQLFQDLDQIVVEQEPLVQNIEYKAEETHTHMVAGNSQMDYAVTSARGARRKKWICLGIVAAIILIVVLIVVIYLAVHHDL